MTLPCNPCVYTVLSGAYEVLNEQPMAAQSGVPFICLTDNPELRSDSWRIVQVPLRFALDPIRSQRSLKIFPYDVPALRDFDASLYIDNTVQLTQTPEAMMQKLPWSSGLGLPLHSYRESVHDEFIEVARGGLDDQGRIFEQLNHYLAVDAAPLDEAPYWTAILLRDHRVERVRDAMAAWRDHVMRYSRRDQLSANHAFAAAKLVPDGWTLDNFRSWFHSWPHAPGRDRSAGPRDPLRSMQPVQTQLRVARVAADADRRELVQLRDDLARAEREAELFAEGATVRLRESADALEAVRRAHALELQTLAATYQTRCDAQAEAFRAALALQRQQAAEAREILVQEFFRSASWRLTGPLRRLSRLLRPR